jgi:hypothetical protein
LIGGTALLLLALLLVSRYNRIVLPQYQNEDLRGLAGHLKSTKSHVPVFVLSGYMAPPLRYYLGDEWKVVALPNVTPAALLEPAFRTIDSVTTFGHPFWLVYTREFHGDPSGRFVDSLARVHRVKRVRDFPGVVLYAGIVGAQGPVRRGGGGRSN